MDHCLQCDVAAVSLVITAWLRYAGTIRSLDTDSSYALLITGQVRIPGSYIHTIFD
jgi:MFS transporter, FLVCR family, MFS-domain-containing protein 7